MVISVNTVSVLFWASLAACSISCLQMVSISHCHGQLIFSLAWKHRLIQICHLQIISSPFFPTLHTYAILALHIELSQSAILWVASTSVEPISLHMTQLLSPCTNRLSILPIPHISWTIINDQIPSTFCLRSAHPNVRSWRQWQHIILFPPNSVIIVHELVGIITIRIDTVHVTPTSL